MSPMRAVVAEEGMTGVGLAVALAEIGIEVDLWVEDDPGSCDRTEHACDRLMAFRRPTDPEKSRKRIHCVPFPETRNAMVFADDKFEHYLRDAALPVSLGKTVPGVPRLRFGSPTYDAKIVELAPDGAARELLSALRDLLSRMGLQVVESSALPDFPGAILMNAQYRAADALLIDATTPWDLDEAMEAFGYAEGICKRQDDEGLDVLKAQRDGQEGGLGWRETIVSDRAVAEGRLGRKAGVGWYRYPGGGGAVIDPLVEDLLREEAWFARIERRELAGEELAERMVLAAINAAADLIDRGCATADQIDVLALHLLGFPAARGSLLHYADEMGAQVILTRLKAITGRKRDPWTPTQGILNKAAAGTRYYP